MQHHDVQGIEHVLRALHPVGMHVTALHHLVLPFHEQQVVLGEFGDGVRADIGEHKSGHIAHGPGLLLHARLRRAARRLARLIEATAFQIIEPAVIGAADALFFYAPVFERRAAMRALHVDHSRPAIGQPEQDKFLTQQTDLLRLHHEMIGNGDRPPVTPEHFSARRSGPHPGQQFVFRHVHMNLLSNALCNILMDCRDSEIRPVRENCGANSYRQNAAAPSGPLRVRLTLDSAVAPPAAIQPSAMPRASAGSGLTPASARVTS